MLCEISPTLPDNLVYNQQKVSVIAMLNKISVVIIAKNAARTLPRTLTSLQPFGEVILYDNGSDDETREIASHYDNCRVIEGDFLGFGPTKRHASTFASNDWILALDSDESVTDKLVEELSQLALDNPNTLYRLKRDNHFLGKHIRFSGWGNDWLVRLYNRQHTNYNDAMVHEGVEEPKGSQIKRLKQSFRHDAVVDMDQLLKKANHYAELRKISQTKTHSPAVILLRSGVAFLRAYLFKLGFLDGWRGLVIAYYNSVSVFFKYFKIYAAKKSGK